MRTSDFDYDLPPELIAQQPVEPRDAARLLLVSRGSGALSHHHVRDLPALLLPGDLLVLNDTRVMAARLLGVRALALWPNRRGLSHVMNNRDVRVVQGGRRARLLREAREPLGIGSELRRQHLDGYLATEASVGCVIDGAHAALA